MRTPLIFDIARGSEVDGPGLRTTIFLKGCPLRCAWCHNPEGLLARPEIAFFADRCHGRLACEPACPRDAIDLAGGGRLRRQRCDACGDCADACDALALRRIGRRYSAARLEELILRDRTLFAVSGGGVTFSGGEPLLHPGFVGRLARRLKKRGIHVAVETCGDYETEAFDREVRPWVDLLLFDVKLVDPASHRRWTGRDNRRILRNLAALAATARPELRVRLPLIPGVTATHRNLTAVAGLLRSLGIRSCETLPYNPSGLHKWGRLGRAAPTAVAEKPMPLATERRWRRHLDRLMNAAEAGRLASPAGSEGRAVAHRPGRSPTRPRGGAVEGLVPPGD